MKISLYYGLPVLLVILLGSTCEKVEMILTGSAEITVTNPNGPLTGVVVTITPAVEGVGAQVTDANGIVRFRDIPTGDYLFVAKDTVFGTMSVAFTINDHPVFRGEIKFREGNNPPDLEINSFNENFASIFLLGDSITVGFLIRDEDQPMGIPWSLTITSSLDGVVFQGPTGFFASDLRFALTSLGRHELTFKITDDTDLSDSDRGLVDVVPVPDTPVLILAQASLTGTVIEWESRDSTQFIRYVVTRIYEDTGEEMDIAFLPFSERTFTDTEAIVGREAKYRITKQLESRNLVSDDLVAEFQYPTVNVGGKLGGLIADPTRSFLYALDQQNERLLFIDVDAGAVTHSLPLNGKPVSFHLNTSADRLYVLIEGQQVVEVFDLERQMALRTIEIELPSDDSHNHSSGLVEVGMGNLVYFTDDFPGMLRLYSGTSGELLSEIPIGRYPTATYHAASGLLYVGSDEPFGGTLQRYFAADGLLTMETSITNLFHAFYYRILISADGACLFHGRQKRLTSSLNSLAGSFNDYLLAISDDGQLAAGSTSIFNATDFTFLRSLPHHLQFGAFPSGSQQFYAYFETTDNLVIIE
ncbi:hypothetical protein QWY85_11695 [Neolewinella lacunae]|uniref:Uncharacterized protein n=1 Tax=Neolewinella lacunae TaxID=1517758 RepID=A0A923PJN0_9BACT|nr:hypothetical protein [Neolewinella lacunae]MBC6993785.1 hypothetical protein [Neolewinella lacunae]MDN3635324.1 hypothetical protein [Neolewinella lacunae]